jgi:hypothetical protein
MVMTSTLLQELQESFHDVANWAEGNHFKINIKETEMIIRKGEKVPTKDRICCKWEMTKNYEFMQMS